MEITKVEPMLSNVDDSELRREAKYIAESKIQVDREIDRFNDTLLDNQAGFSYLDILLFTVKHPSSIKYATQLFFGSLMKKPAQIVGAIVGVAGLLYKVFGGHEIPPEVADGITAVALFVWGLFTSTEKN